jgi:hypothetical protein
MTKKLMKVSEFRSEYFEEGSRPMPKTIRSWIDAGTLPGQRIGGTYYVDLSRWEGKTGNPLVDKVLAA